jgi:Asp-tRNA(Asn)/Glu-tRNA(Gln) amidotransferase A subunit family amidase
MERTLRSRRGAWLVVLLAAVPLTPRAGTAQIEVTEASIEELQRAMAAGETTSVEVTQAYLARIRAYDQAGASLNAMIRINPDALAEAEALDRERATRGTRGPLHGIPVILKDNYDLVGMPSTASTLGLAGLMPPDDAFQVRKLREAGAVFIGKSNLHELARGITTISSLGGQTLNPYDLRRNPGGSSGGTGAAIAASFAAVGWGSDTCGSIRIPSAHNNLVGLRPTKGLSSIDGIVPLSHTQDTGGPLARTVPDLAVALDATVGYDPADPATDAMQGRPLPAFTEVLDPNALDGARIGILEDLFGEGGAAAPANDVVRAAIGEMVGLGADTVTVEMPDLDSLLANSSVIRAEFEDDFARYLSATPGAPVGSFDDLLREGLVHEALTSRMGRRILPGERDDEAYQASLAKRAPLADAVVALMNTHRLDAVVYPTVREIPSLNPDPQRGGTCQLAAHSGLPAISVPAGFTSGDLPIGMELLARPFEDARLVALAYAFEQGTDHRRTPPSTPPLLNGLAPPPVSFSVRERGRSGTDVSGRFTFDPVQGTLSYEIDVAGVAPEDLHGIALRASDEDDRFVVARSISGPERTDPRGTLVLTPRNRARFEAGELHLEVFTRAHPLGAVRARLAPTLPDPSNPRDHEDDSDQ